MKRETTNANWVEVACETCKAPFWGLAYRNRRFCSLRCAATDRVKSGKTRGDYGHKTCPPHLKGISPDSPPFFYDYCRRCQDKKAKGLVRGDEGPLASPPQQRLPDGRRRLFIDWDNPKVRQNRAAMMMRPYLRTYR